MTHRYHDVKVQRQILRSGRRQEIIDWLKWNDPNGCYTDEDSKRAGRPKITVEIARDFMQRQLCMGEYKYDSPFQSDK